MDYFEGILEYKHYRDQEDQIDFYSKLFIKGDCLRELVYNEAKELVFESIYNPSFQDHSIQIDHINEVVYQSEITYKEEEIDALQTETTVVDFSLTKKIIDYDCIGTKIEGDSDTTIFIGQQFSTKINYFPNYFYSYKGQQQPIFYFNYSLKADNKLLFGDSKSIESLEKKNLDDDAFLLLEQEFPSYRRLSEDDFIEEQSAKNDLYNNIFYNFCIQTLENAWDRRLNDEELNQAAIDLFEEFLSQSEAHKVAELNQALSERIEQEKSSQANLKKKYDALLKAAEFPIKADIEMAIIKKNGLAGMLYLLGQENYTGAIPLKDLTDPSCPWFAYKDDSSQEVVAKIWAPLYDKLPYFIDLLQERCLHLFVLKQNETWELVYLLDVLIEEKPYFAFYTGIAPVSEEELKENASIAKKVSANLLHFYQIHNGYGELHGESVLPIEELAKTKKDDRIFINFFDYGAAARQAILADDIQDENPLTYDIGKIHIQAQQHFWKFLDDRLAYIDED